MKKILWLLCLIISPAFAKPHVVASFSILGNMVSRIAGDHVEIYTIVGPNQDAHVYEPTPKDARALHHANLIIMNGLGFERWMDRLIEASGFHGEKSIATDGIASLYMEEKNQKIEDPHAWHVPLNGVIYIDNITKALADIDPENAFVFQKNAHDLKEELTAIESWSQEEIQTINPKKRTVMTAHDAFGYLAQSLSLTLLAPVGLSTDAAPSAKTMAHLIKEIKAQNINAIFVENISSPRIVEQIARETNLKISGTLYSDALSKEGKPGDSYPNLLRHNISSLIKALKE